MEEGNNIGGLVSKITNLIKSNTNKEKETKKNIGSKRYNIKISTDDKDLDNMDDNLGEEEEEEEEEEKKEDTKKEDPKEDNKNEDIKKEEEEKEKEEIRKKELGQIQDIVKEIMDNNDKENENEDNIVNSNDNSVPINYSPEDLFDEETACCHIMLKKGNDININDFIITPILFMEKQKNILYKMGMMNQIKYEPKEYLFFFDEHFLYFAKDEINFEEMDEDTRRISKVVSLFDIKDFETENDGDKFLIRLLVQKEEKKEKEVSFYVESDCFSGFMKDFNLKLSIYGIDFFSHKKIC